jgi:threonine/homoserine/homoserine lactone efflux protein
MVLIVTPGPDLFYVLTRGISEGWRTGVLSAIGVTSGILVHTLMASLGVVILLKMAPYVFILMKCFGVLYLIYMGGSNDKKA